MLIDSHIHLSNYAFDNEFPFLEIEDGNLVLSAGNREELIDLCKAAGIQACIDPAIEFETNEKLQSGGINSKIFLI